MSSPFPCPNPPSTCDTNPNPATSFSSEEADSTTFIGLAWNGTPPPLNKPFNLVPCEAIQESQVSQVDADRLAQNAAVVCASACTQPFQNRPQTAIGSCADGSAYSLTVPAGQYAAENQVLADRKAFTAASQALIGHSICMGSLTPLDVCRSSFYFGQVSILSTNIPATTEVTSGEIPTGLNLQSQSDRVVIEGTPTAFGIFQFTLTSTSAAGVVTSKTFTITVSGIITDSSLPDAFGGTPYMQVLTTYNPNNLPVAWAIVSGTLPAGLTLDASSGIISGTVSASGTFTFTVASTVDGFQCEKNFTLIAQLINWGNVVWSDVLTRAASGGSATGVYSGGTLAVSAQGGPGDFSLAHAIGTLTYAGPNAPCVVTINTSNGPSSVMGLVVNQDGLPILNVAAAQMGTPGVHQFTFTVSATLGSTITIVGQPGVPVTASFVYSADATPKGAYTAVFTNA